MQKTFEGLGGIKATVIADSISEAGVRLTTFEIEVPRIVWSEFMTHRQFSRNASSSRAIPFAKMKEQLTGMPVSFGKNQAGMQASEEEFPEYIQAGLKCQWELAKKSALHFAESLSVAGAHKQVFNRLLEPFSMIKAVVSATEYDNFFWLRDDPAADPTIAELARVMREAQEASTPQLLKAGEWHLPYVACDYFSTKDGADHQHFYLSEDDHISAEISLEDAIKVSCARCAAVSYRNEGYGLEKSMELYERLVGAGKKHASALEHCATPMKKVVYEQDAWEFSVTDLNRSINLPFEPETWEQGISHVDRDCQLWSGNLSGWIQHRKTVKGECFNG